MITFLILPLFGAVYFLTRVIHNLFLHPLSGFPGPKIAAATHLWEIAYDYFGHGAYLWEIERMHKKYGPIVRVNPTELSVKDPDFYSELYVNRNVRRTEALPTFGDGMDFNGSHGMTVDHDHHRQRRKPLEPFFSKAGVARFESSIAEVVKILVDRLKEHSGTGRVVRLDNAFAALAGDIISRMCIKEPSECMLEHPDFSPEWHELFHTLIKSMPIFMNFPLVIKLVRLVPTWLLLKLDPRSQIFRDWRTMSVAEIERAMNSKKQDGELGSTAGTLRAPTVFDHLVRSDLPPSELTVERLGSEAQVLLGAGTVTTAQTLSHLAVHIMLQPEIETRLRRELADAMVDTTREICPPTRQLEKLPYLQACIKEGLRLSHGLMHRLPRVSPDQELVCHGWVIPRKTPVGMSAYFMHTDEDVFPEPFVFRPERWLGDIDPRMERNFVPFSRGSRRCLAPHLANAEVSMVIAALFSPQGPRMKLFKTDASDVDPACVFLLPLPRLDSSGVSITVV